MSTRERESRARGCAGQDQQMPQPDRAREARVYVRPLRRSMYQKAIEKKTEECPRRRRKADAGPRAEPGNRVRRRAISSTAEPGLRGTQPFSASWSRPCGLDAIYGEMAKLRSQVCEMLVRAAVVDNPVGVCRGRRTFCLTGPGTKAGGLASPQDDPRRSVPATGPAASDRDHLVEGARGRRTEGVEPAEDQFGIAAKGSPRKSTLATPRGTPVCEQSRATP